MIRSAMAIASSTSWVTMRVVVLALQDERQQLFAQPRRERGVERDERLVEEEKIGLDREGPGDRHAAGQPQRQFAGKMIEMSRKTQGSGDFGEIVLARCANKTQVLRDAAPGQKPGLLENHAGPACALASPPGLQNRCRDQR